MTIKEAAEHFGKTPDEIIAAMKHFRKGSDYVNVGRGKKFSERGMEKLKAAFEERAEAAESLAKAIDESPVVAALAEAVGYKPPAKEELHGVVAETYPNGGALVMVGRKGYRCVVKRHGVFVGRGVKIEGLNGRWEII